MSSKTHHPVAQGCLSGSHSSPAPQALLASHAGAPQNWVLTWRTGAKPWGNSLEDLRVELSCLGWRASKKCLAHAKPSLSPGLASSSRSLQRPSVKPDPLL